MYVYLLEHADDTHSPFVREGVYANRADAIAAAETSAAEWRTPVYGWEGNTTATEWRLAARDGHGSQAWLVSRVHVR